MAVVLAVVAALVCGVASSGFAWKDNSVKIAMITAKTGEAGASNSVSFVGARFAVDELNARGGILGRRVKLLEYDNKSTPEGSAEAARMAVNDGVAAVVGSNWSSHSLAMAQVLQAARIPMISHMSTNPSVTRVGDYIFRICFTDSFQGLGLARFAIERLHAHTAVILVNEKRAFSIGLAETFGNAFTRLGGGVLWRAGYDMDHVDYTAMIREVEERGADVLFIPGGYNDVAAFAEQVKARGLPVSILSADGVGPKLYEMIGEDAEGIYYSGHWSRWVDTRKSREFVERYEAKAGYVREDTIALVYDCFMLIADAMERAGSIEGPAVRQALAQTGSYEGVTGLIRFDEHGDPIKPMVINQLKHGGIYYLEQVYP
jgi:branched-chain amino acid transport system substrate-binding protein